MADLLGMLVVLLLVVLPVVAALLFRNHVAYRIPGDVLRIVSIGGFYLLALAGAGWGSLAVLASAFNLGGLYPVTTHPIDDTYYFTQQEYGFVTMTSSGYDLTFYQQRPYWLDQDLGKVQLECSGKETIRATLQPVQGGRIRLRIAADNQQRLDTTLNTAPPFNFRRTFEDHTLDFSQRP